MLYVVLPGCSWSMNHSRACANDGGSGEPSRGTRTIGGTCTPAPSRSAASTRSASPATVDVSKSARSGISVPSAACARATTRVASSECPPRSKKFSPTPTRSTPSTSAQIPASTSSVTVRGATYASSAPPYSGAGNAFRSSFPTGVSGSRSSTTTADGTMYSGRLSRSCARSSAPSTSPTTYATRRFSPGSSSRTTTRASRTPACAATKLSTSPGSIRNPRILTCSSRRPMNSSVPSAFHLSLSPVRYIRVPGSTAYGSGTKRSAVSPGRSRYPRTTPAPPTYASPGTPTGTGCSARSRM